MKIVFPLINLSASGGIRVTLQYASGLAKLGHKIVVVLPSGASVHYFEIPENVPIHLVQIPPGIHKYLGYFADVLSLGRAIPPCDVIIANSWQAVYPALVGASIHRHRRIVHLLQGLDSVINAGRPRPIRLRNKVLFELVYRLPIAKIVVSTWLQRLLAEKYHQQSVCVSNGVDVASFTSGYEPLWAPPEGHYDVLCLGRTAKEKGFQDIVQAVRMLAADNHHIRLIVATREKLELPADFPVVLIYPENDSQLGKFYQTCSVFVFASWSEGFGLPVLEAMACGAPVITTDCGGIDDFAHDGKNCLIVPPQQPAVLANAIQSLKKDPSLANQLSRCGIETGKEFSIEKMVGRLEQVIQSGLV